MAIKQANTFNVSIRTCQDGSISATDTKLNKNILTTIVIRVVLSGWKIKILTLDELVVVWSVVTSQNRFPAHLHS